MRIIVLDAHTPDPSGATGARVSAHLVRQLVRKGHRIHYVVSRAVAPELLAAASGFIDAPRDAFSIRAVQRRPERVWRRKLRSAIWPNRPPADCSVRQAVEQAMGDGYDVLHVEDSAAWYGTHHDRALLSVQSLQTIDLAGQPPLAGFSNWKQAVQCRRQETQVIRGYRHVRCLTPPLAETVRQINRGALTYVVPLGLDVANYPVLPDPAGPLTVGMIGSMFWRPSREAAQRLIDGIFPLVRKAVPSVRLLVAGWAAREFLRTPASGGNVEILSDVRGPEDFFRRVHVLVYAPGRGSGIKVKVAEALAYGRGVVTTVDGTEGLGLTAGDHVLVGATDRELASAAAELLIDTERRHRLAAAGREAIRDLLSPERTTALMENTYSSVCSG